MGLFDEESSEDERPAQEAGTCDQDDEEEDPLDAFMNSLDANTACSKKSGGGRLDVDAEEEAKVEYSTSMRCLLFPHSELKHLTFDY